MEKSIENLNASSVEDTANLLAQHFPKQEIQWTAPTYWELLNQVRSCHGSLGPDSWHSNEVRHLPEKAIQIFRIFAQRWGRTQQVPKAMTQGRMTSLIKPGRIQNQEIATCDLRPITVLNVWWRCWAGAWAHCISMKHYAKALPPFVSGIHQHLETEESATILQDAFVSKNGFLFSLDYKKAFDRMNANSSSSFLQRLVSLLPLLVLSSKFGTHNGRCSMDKAYLPKFCRAIALRKDVPLHQLLLSVGWSVVSGHFFVQQGLSLRGHTAQAIQQAVTGIYMDDRSFVDSGLHRSIDRVDTWAEWSSRVQLRENLDKYKQLPNNRDSKHFCIMKSRSGHNIAKLKYLA